MTLVMEGVFRYRRVGLAQRLNTDGRCMSIDAVARAYEIRVRVVIDVVLQRAHGWVAIILGYAVAGNRRRSGAV